MPFTFSDKKIKDLIELVFPDVVRIRRLIHQNPELSGSEFQTASLIHKSISGIGLKPSFHMNKTAVSASISNGPGKTIVLRADMDALPIEEKTGLSFSSRVPGVMHACGHDMHTAILFGAAAVLKSIKKQWKGKIVFLFQPSEEVEPGGAKSLINQGAFPRKTDAVFGLHVSADHLSGTIGVKEGVDYAGITAFDVTIKGVGGHGATPEKAIDPVVCTASIISQLQTIISREIPPFTPAILTIGSVHAGSLRNIIPDQAVFHGTIRSHSRECLDTIARRTQEMVCSIATSFRASANCSFEKSYPPGYNDPDMTQRFVRAFSYFTSDRKVDYRSVPSMYAEDFAYYQEKAPGVYIYLGVRPEKKKTEGYGIHTSRFNPDESAIKTGIAAHTAFALEVLQ